MPTGVPSRADRQLSQQLRDEGFAWVRDTHPQRWRRAGAIPDVTVERPTRGSLSRYPEGTLDQSKQLCDYLERHHDLNKCVVLLWLAGYAIEARALRQAFRRGLDWLDEKIAAYRQPGTSEDEVAARVGWAIVETPRRTPHDQATRSDAIRTAGGREALAGVYKQFMLLYLGVRGGAAGFFTAARRAGWDVATLQTQAGERLAEFHDQQAAELAAAGGVGSVLRSTLPKMRTEDFDRIRGFLREMCEFATQRGDRFGLTEQGFLTDCAEALGYRELPPKR
jgi:hypothetical protein